MFNRAIETRIVKKSEKDENTRTMGEVLDELASTERQEAMKSLVRFVGIQTVKWVAITTLITTTAKIAENRLSK